MSKAAPDFCFPPAEKLQNFFGVFLQFQIGVDNQTKDIKLAQAAAGHTTSAMTLRYYVKGRETISKAAAVVDRAYSG